MLCRVGVGVVIVVVHARRSVTPWVVVSGHRPLYVSTNMDVPPDGDITVALQLREELEPLWLQYKVRARQGERGRGRCVRQAARDLSHAVLISARGAACVEVPGHAWSTLSSAAATEPSVLCSNLEATSQMSETAACRWRAGLPLTLTLVVPLVVRRWRVGVTAQVDLTVHGHHHTYQRTCPMANGACVGYDSSGAAKGPVHLIVGLAGARARTHARATHTRERWRAWWWAHRRLCFSSVRAGTSVQALA